MIDGETIAIGASRWDSLLANFLPSGGPHRFRVRVPPSPFRSSYARGARLTEQKPRATIPWPSRRAARLIHTTTTRGLRPAAILLGRLLASLCLWDSPHRACSGAEPGGEAFPSFRLPRWAGHVPRLFDRITDWEVLPCFSARELHKCKMDIFFTSIKSIWSKTWSRDFYYVTHF